MSIPTFTILGAGIAGLSTAIALKKIGIQARVFEAAPAFKPLGAGLLLAANAVQAYRKIGISEKIIARGRALPLFEILDARGRLISQIDAASIQQKYGVHNFAIHRADLHEALLEQLVPGQVQYGKRATGILPGPNGAQEVRFADGSSQHTDFLIVADGIHSAIRQQILPGATERYAGYTCWRAVIDAGAIHQTSATESWGTAGRFGIVPLTGERIYWFACVNAPKNDPALRDFRVADLLRIFGNFHDPIPAILAQTRDADLIWNDIVDLKPIPRFAFGNVLLLGDAAHATTPNMGQGACQAIEDAAVLADVLKKQFADPAAAFRAFEQRRLKRTHFIVNNSWTLGRMAQWQNPLLAALRNGLFRMVPGRVNEAQLEKVLTVDF
ncbi:MAG: FAD-dependent monooxygenase [Saprospiraceae bacterium]|nr:FAD-dependent monooxygenase [Lewinellaceae bacterium]